MDYEKITFNKNTPKVKMLYPLDPSMNCLIIHIGKYTLNSRTVYLASLMSYPQRHLGVYGVKLSMRAGELNLDIILSIDGYTELWNPYRTIASLHLWEAIII